MQTDRNRRRRLALHISMILGVAATPTIWAGATLDGSMGSTGSFSGNFTIPDTVGQTRGANLFHSFSDFSINAGESATFTGPDAINNVVSRVTGNSPSTFNGPLTSAIPSANFYFLNPNGILFKEGAQINVDGSFYATTSDFVRLGQDGIFYADPATQSVLTSSAPSAFGFLDSNPGQIALEGTQLVKYMTLNQPDGATLSLVGGDIRMDQAPAGTVTPLGVPNSYISATGNGVEMVSIESAGEAVPDSGSYDLSSFDTLGNVAINGGSVVDATDVYIRGGQIVLDDSAIAPGFFYVAGLAPPPNGGSVDIGAREQISITGTTPLPVARPDGGPYLAGITAFGGSPLDGAPPTDGADINISGSDISVSGVAAVISERFGPGQAGDINISGDSVEVRNGAFVANINTYDGAGGNITVDADQVTLDGEGDPTGLTGLNASSNFSVVFGDDTSVSNPFLPEFTTGDAGTITVNAAGPGGLTIGGGASISTESRAFGQAGDISIDASDISLSRDGMPFGAVASQSVFAGDAGNITINAARNIGISDGFEITGSTAGTGTGGNVSVTAGNVINISGNNSGIASAAPEPPAAVKDALAQRFGTANFDELVTVLNGFGLVSLDADMYDVLGALQTIGLINLGDPNPTAGDAGPVSLTATTLSIDGPSRITSSTSSDGNGGPVALQVGSLALANGAEIRSRSGLINQTTGELEVGAGNGGDISVTASDTVSLQSGASISSQTLGTGLAGNVSIDAGQALNLTDSSISTQATVSDGGNIDIAAINQVYLLNSNITTSVESGVGGGGNINIDPQFMILNNSNILANAYGGPGGNINLVAENFIISAGSRIDASSALGVDGTVNLSSPDKDVAKDLAVLPANYQDVTGLISDRCTAATAGASSLVAAGPGGLAVDPDGYLPSFAVATVQEDEGKGRSSSVRGGNRWWAEESTKSALLLAQVDCTR